MHIRFVQLDSYNGVLERVIGDASVDDGILATILNL